MDPETFINALIARYGSNNNLWQQQMQRFQRPPGQDTTGAAVTAAVTPASLTQQPPPWRSPLLPPQRPSIPIPATPSGAPQSPLSTTFPTGLPQPPPRPATAAAGGAGATGAPASANPSNLIQYDVPGVIGQPTGMSRSPIYTTGNMFAGAPNRGAPGVDPSIQARGGMSPPLPGQSQSQPAQAPGSSNPFQGFLSRLTAPPPGQENRQGLLGGMPGANQLGALANAAANISRAFGGQGQGNTWQPQSMSPNGFRPQGGWWNGWQGG